MTNKIDSTIGINTKSPTLKAMDSFNLKNQLQYYLELRQYSAAELSRRSKVSKQVISLWMSGSKPRNIEQLNRVAKALQTTIDNLCFGKGSDATEAIQIEKILSERWIDGLFHIKLKRLKQDRGD